MSQITRAQIAAIHTLKSKAKLDDLSYRDMLEQQVGERSASKLTSAAAGRVIEHLQGLTGGKTVPAAPGLGGIWGKKAQALWISGWHLGVFRDRKDTALQAFVRGQTKVDHINWVKDPKHGSAVVDALKAILSRDAGVNWREAKDPAVCVVLAQVRLLQAAGQDPIFIDLYAASRSAITAQMRAFGDRVRRIGRSS